MCYSSLARRHVLGDTPPEALKRPLKLRLCLYRSKFCGENPKYVASALWILAWRSSTGRLIAECRFGDFISRLITLLESSCLQIDCSAGEWLWSSGLKLRRRLVDLPGWTTSNEIGFGAQIHRL